MAVYGQTVSDRAWIKDAGSHKRPLLGLVFEAALSPISSLGTVS